MALPVTIQTQSGSITELDMGVSSEGTFSLYGRLHTLSGRTGSFEWSGSQLHIVVDGLAGNKPVDDLETFRSSPRGFLSASVGYLRAVDPSGIIDTHL